MKALSSHLIATLAMLLTVTAATADSHATFGDASGAALERAPDRARPHTALWAVLPWLTRLAETPRSVIVSEAPMADPPTREKPTRRAPLWTPVEEVEEHVRGGLAQVSYLVSR